MFNDLCAVERYLDSLINYEHDFPLGGKRDRPKLEPTRRAVERLRLTLRLPGCAHVAGTKGKGSTTAFMEALLAPQAETLSFTSPHLVSVTERVRHGGRALPNALWQEGFAAIVPQLRQSPAIELTYFETTFVFFLWTAARLQTQIHLVEAGLGGTWDVTNLLEDTLPVLTPVDYDHMEVLGYTLTEIARDKGGIVKPGSIAVIGRQQPETQAVYDSIVAEQQATALRMNRDYGWSDEQGGRFAYYDGYGRISGLTLRPPGLHQRDNAATAICAARRLAPALTAEAIRRRLALCEIPGRQQLLHGTPPVLLDVAHNPVSFRALADTLREHFAGCRIHAVIGMRGNKDARSALRHLRGLVDTIYPVEIQHPQAFRPAELGALAGELGMTVVYTNATADAFARLHAALPEVGLVAGSFYLAGEYLEWRRCAGIA